MSKRQGLGIVSATDVTALDAQLSGQMDALNAAVGACTTLAPSDVTAWAGLYASWKALHAQWQGAQNPGWYTLPGTSAIETFTLLVASDTYAQMRGFAAQLPDWQARVAKACPSYHAPPGITVPPQDPSNPETDFFTNLTKTTQAVAIAAASIALAYGIFKVFQIVDPIRKSLTEEAHR